MADPVRMRFTVAAVDELQLHEEIVAFGVPGFVGVCRDGLNVDLLFASALTFVQAANVTAIVTAHVPNPGNKAGRAAKEAKDRLNDPQTPDSHSIRAVLRAMIPALNQMRQILGLAPIDELSLLGAVIAQLPVVPVVTPPAPLP